MWTGQKYRPVWVKRTSLGESDLLALGNSASIRNHLLQPPLMQQQPFLRDKFSIYSSLIVNAKFELEKQLQSILCAAVENGYYDYHLVTKVRYCDYFTFQIYVWSVVITL